jgi:hypothetical protein
MQLGLVDRLRLLIFPLILGSVGREPIYAVYPRTVLELIDTSRVTTATAVSQNLESTRTDKSQTR